MRDLLYLLTTILGRVFQTGKTLIADTVNGKYLQFAYDASGQRIKFLRRNSSGGVHDSSWIHLERRKDHYGISKSEREFSDRSLQYRRE